MVTGQMLYEKLLETRPMNENLPAPAAWVDLFGEAQVAYEGLAMYVSQLVNDESERIIKLLEGKRFLCSDKGCCWLATEYACDCKEVIALIKGGCVMSEYIEQLAEEAAQLERERIIKLLEELEAVGSDPNTLDYINTQGLIALIKGEK